MAERCIGGDEDMRHRLFMCAGCLLLAATALAREVERSSRLLL
jgi:hypothetical protein